jgi:hypothetical protein
MIWWITYDDQYSLYRSLLYLKWSEQSSFSTYLSCKESLLYAKQTPHMAFLTEHVANRLVSLAKYLKYSPLPRFCFSLEEVAPAEGGFYIDIDE